MARETKVGLLAGLAFIICFAIILANRGRQEPIAPPRSYLADGGASVPGAVQQGASRMNAMPAGRDAAVPRADRPAPVAPPASGAELLLPDSPVARPLAPARNPVDGGESGVNPTGERVLTSRIQDDILRRQELERRLGNPAPDSGATGAPNPQTALPSGSRSSPRPESSANLAPYTVAPGDTLSKIALAQFGNKSRASINAIFEANRSILTSPDTLKAGLVLSLPALEAAPRAAKSESPKPESPTAKAPTPARTEEGKSHPSKKSVEKPAPAPRWYQVRKNDRYVSIAREQLGDAARWRELHELNKDKFPDPKMIREGVRIKLPTTKVPASAEGRS
ncbi:MAG: LysM peptidoglycan-binding domain-containing protein [Planctomycetota bacterium]